MRRERKGSGARLAGSCRVPQNWQAFLEDSSDKKELFSFLTKQVESAAFPDDKVVCITSGNTLTVIYSVGFSMWPQS